MKLILQQHAHDRRHFLIAEQTKTSLSCFSSPSSHSEFLCDSVGCNKTFMKGHVCPAKNKLNYTNNLRSPDEV